MLLTIELSFVDNILDPIVSHMSIPSIAATNASTTWQIQNVQVKCDIVTVGSGLNEPYINLFEDRQKLTLNYDEFICQYQTIVNQTDFSLNSSRS